MQYNLKNRLSKFEDIPPRTTGFESASRAHLAVMYIGGQNNRDKRNFTAKLGGFLDHHNSTIFIRKN